MKTSLHNQLFVNDCCLSYLTNVKNETFDISITSPPYNLGINYSSYNDKREKTEYLSWINSIFCQVYRVLKQDASLFLNIGSKVSDPIFYQSILGTVLKSGFVVQNEIVWIKSIYIPEHKTFGHFKPINSNKYINNTHEFIYHLVKNKININKESIGAPYTDKSNLKRWNKKTDKRCIGNSWFIPYETKNKFDLHPASFPVELVDKCIKLVDKGNSIVLDPFSGSGTVAIASYNNNCSSVNIEVDKLYYNTGISNFTTSTSKQL